MEYRAYKEGSDKLSVIGLGGVLLVNESRSRSQEIVSEAVDKGVNYFDVAPTYGDGQAEENLGPALAAYRNDVFLAGKTMARTENEARRLFEQTLKRLKTDHLDLYQLHALHDVKEDVETAFADDGIMNYLLRQKERGLIRYLGFSAHTEEAAFEAFSRYPFDSVLFPVSFSSMLNNGFGRRIMETAQKHRAAALAIKGLAKQTWAADDTRKDHSKCWYEPLSSRDDLMRALRWTLSQPITAMIPPGERYQFFFALDALNEGLGPVSDEDLQILNDQAKKLRPVFPIRD